MAQDAPSHLQSPVNVGDIVDKYRVERVLGIGAMGIVVAARHTTLDQVVAIKFLIEHRFGSLDESLARFLGEARAAARIESDFVCRVFDVGMLGSGIPYMIMEHLDGNDLEEEIVSRGQLDLTEAVDYVLQALDAIAAAHQLGIVHRDLKPANLFLARRPDGSRRVKVLDFGISKATAMGMQRFTRETRSLGTPAYMAPEQVSDPMNVDHRADLWALGAILYEVLTGQMAFVGENIKEVLDRVMAEEPCPITALRPDVPPALIDVVSRALVRDREQRWPTAGLFARALAPFGSIGVLSGLASIQREVGSLSSVSERRLLTPMAQPVHMGQLGPTASMTPAPPHGAVPSSSVEPMVSSLSRPTLPDPSELSRRHLVVQDWAALQTRRRKVRAALLGMATVLLVAAAVTILIYRVRRHRVVPPDAIASSSSGEVGPVVAVAAPEATVVPAPTLPASASSVSRSVHPASSSVYPASSSVRGPRSPKAPRRAP